MEKNCLVFYKDSDIKGGSYYDRNFFIKYLPDISTYLIPSKDYLFLDNYNNIFFGFYPPWIKMNLKNKNTFQCIVSPDDKILEGSNLSTNNLKYSNIKKIPLLPFINEFYIKHKKNFHGTYLTKNSKNKINILIEWLNKNIKFIDKFFIMSTFKDAIKLIKLFGNKIILTHDKKYFFENVKNIIYPRDPDFFEFFPNFIKEAVNCNCSINIIGDTKIKDGVNDIINLKNNPFQIDKVILFYKYFISKNFSIPYKYNKTYSDFVNYINNEEY